MGKRKFFRGFVHFPQNSQHGRQGVRRAGNGTPHHQKIGTGGHGPHRGHDPALVLYIALKGANAGRQANKISAAGLFYARGFMSGRNHAVKPPGLGFFGAAQHQRGGQLFLGKTGADRLALGQWPAPFIGGKSYHRIGDGDNYGMTLYDTKGSERGGMGFMGMGRVGSG